MVKRKRLGKIKTNKVSLSDVADKRKKAAEKELRKTEKQIASAKEECAVQKKRKQNAAAPIEKRKPLGYDSVSAGARVEFEKAKRQRRLERRLERKEQKAAGMLGLSDGHADSDGNEAEKRRRGRTEGEEQLPVSDKPTARVVSASKDGATSANGFASLLSDVIR